VSVGYETIPPSCKTPRARWMCRGCGCRGSIGWMGAPLATWPMFRRPRDQGKKTDRDDRRRAVDVIRAFGILRVATSAPPRNVIVGLSVPQKHEEAGPAGPASVREPPEGLARANGPGA